MVLKDNQSFIRDLPSFTNHSSRRRKRKDVYNLEFEIELPTNYQSETEIRALSSIPGQRIFDSALLVENYINVLICIKERGRLIWLKIGMRRNQMFDETNGSNCLEFESSLFLIDVLIGITDCRFSHNVQ